MLTTPGNLRPRRGGYGGLHDHGRQQGDDTLRHVVEYQKRLVGTQNGFREERGLLTGVMRVEVQTNVAVLSTEVAAEEEV